MKLVFKNEHLIATHEDNQDIENLYPESEFAIISDNLIQNYLSDNPEATMFDMTIDVIPKSAFKAHFNSIRKKELSIADIYDMPSKWESYTDEQKQELILYKKSWLNMPELKGFNPRSYKKPERPEWMK